MGLSCPVLPFSLKYLDVNSQICEKWNLFLTNYAHVQYAYAYWEGNKMWMTHAVQERGKNILIGSGFAELYISPEDSIGVPGTQCRRSNL